MDAADLMYAGATTQAALVATGEVSSRELVEACLSRIEALDPQLNAFVDVYAEEALAAADNIDRSRATGSAAGLLSGVPIAVKDEHDIAGHPTGWGLAGNKRLGRPLSTASWNDIAPNPVVWWQRRSNEECGFRRPTAGQRTDRPGVVIGS